MLMDRETDIVTAMMSSARAVGFNLGAMILWAAIIVGSMALGFASLLFGMVILLPIRPRHLARLSRASSSKARVVDRRRTLPRHGRRPRRRTGRR